MNVKINESAISYDINKELSVIDGSPFQLEDMTSLVQRNEIEPKLLSTLLNSTAMQETFMSDTFKYDEENWGAQLPEGKPYSGKGKDLDKDQPRQLRFQIPSFGLRFNTAPQDYIGRRRPGTTNEFLTEADVQAQQNFKSQQSWSLFEEYCLAFLLRTDTNVVRGGPFASQNFYDLVAGTAVTAGLPTFEGVPATRQTTSMQLGSASVDHVLLFRRQRKILEQRLARANDSASEFVCVCGDNFYDQRYEIAKKEGLARPIIPPTPDLASTPVGTINVGGLNYDTFRSEDGIRYINYGSEIIDGEKLIPDDNGYLLPVGAQKLIGVGFAPSQTRQYANTEALSMYAWTFVNEFQGVVTMQESNKLYMYKNPQNVIHLTV